MNCMKQSVLDVPRRSMGFSIFVMVIEPFCMPAQIEAPARPSVRIEVPARPMVRIEAPARLHFFLSGSAVVLVTLLVTSLNI
jgi:hypothetical protein